jgi:hypothetical protein
MSAALQLLDHDASAEFAAMVRQLRRRYRRLAAGGGDAERRAVIARTGCKLVELASLAEGPGVCRRDAALAPLLAAWLMRQLTWLEAGALEPRMPLDVPLAFRRPAASLLLPA